MASNYSTEGQCQNYGTNAIYIAAHGDDDGEDYFFSPDGIGKVYFDTLEEAKEETGLTKTVWIGN
jgi:hypothetical protein